MSTVNNINVSLFNLVPYTGFYAKKIDEKILSIKSDIIMKGCFMSNNETDFTSVNFQRGSMYGYTMKLPGINKRIDGQYLLAKTNDNGTTVPINIKSFQTMVDGNISFPNPTLSEIYNNKYYIFTYDSKYEALLQRENKETKELEKVNFFMMRNDPSTTYTVNGSNQFQDFNYDKDIISLTLIPVQYGGVKIRKSKSTKKPDASKKVVKKPDVAKEVVKKSIASKKVVKKPDVAKEVVKKSIASKKVVKKPDASKKVVKKPAASKKVVKKPDASKKVVKKPAASKKVVKKPAASKK